MIGAGTKLFETLGPGRLFALRPIRFLRTIGQVKRRLWTLKLSCPGSGRSQKNLSSFSQNPAHPSLRFERLAYDPRLWSVRVTSSYRAVGVREGEEIIWFWIGSHDEFDRAFPRR